MDVQLVPPEGRKRRAVPDQEPRAAEEVLAGLRWRPVARPLALRVAATRVRVGDGPTWANNRHLPGEEAWLVGEPRPSGERKYHLSNLPPGTPLRALVAAIKARWVCEQAHQQLKDELGLDHYEGRGWRGLHHRALLCLISLAFLQAMRLGGKTTRTGIGTKLRVHQPDPVAPGPPPKPTLPAVRRSVAAALLDRLARCPNCGHGLPWHMLV